MVGIIEVKAGYDAAKAAFQIAQGMSALKTEAAINGAIIELQRHTVDAQRGLSASLETIGELEKEIVRLENWSAEKERYKLKAISPRAYAYTIKPGIEGGDDPHWLCQPCFDSSHKSVLQWAGKTVSPSGITGTFATWGCRRCGQEIHVGRNQSPGDPNANNDPTPNRPLNYDTRGIV